MGLDATVITFEKMSRLSRGDHGRVMGGVRIANRNVDIVELESFVIHQYWGSDVPVPVECFLCNYMVNARIDGLERLPRAELKPVRKGFWRSPIVDVQWEAKDWKSEGLVQKLNSDVDLRVKLCHMENSLFGHLEIKPYRNNQYVRIRQKRVYPSPESAFPSAEAFEALDRIAHYVRTTANV